MGIANLVARSFTAVAPVLAPWLNPKPFSTTRKAPEVALSLPRGTAAKHIIDESYFAMGQNLEPWSMV